MSRSVMKLNRNGLWETRREEDNLNGKKKDRERTQSNPDIDTLQKQMD